MAVAVVDARILVDHEPLCDGLWKLKIDRSSLGDFTQTGRLNWFDTDPIEVELCDNIGRKGNGGTLFYALECTASYRCPARARVRKGFLQDIARDALEAVR